ncbi:MAG: hypothetical protein LBJ33_06035 [Pseudomonas putida]|nr:hypothetical protein [Pseudomonas putida]
MAVGVLVCSELVQAAEVHIIAAYRDGKLQINAPAAPYCDLWPELCSAGRTVMLPITYRKTLDPRGGQRDRFYINSRTRQTGMLSGPTGDQYPFDFEFQAYGLSVRTSRTSDNPVYFSFYGACSMLRRSSQITSWAQIVLRVDGNGSACYADRGSQTYIYSLEAKEIGAAYQLDLPVLSQMKPGRYLGRVSYSVGSAGDIDLGNSVTIDDTVLDVWVELTITRDIQVEFPPGTDRAVLEPPGGWRTWIGGKPPRQLLRDIPFRISIEGPFSVYLNCEYAVTADRCGLRNEHGDQVAVATRLTLSNVNSGGSGAIKVTLPATEHDKRQFDPMQVLRNQPGKLHFSVEGDEVKRMIDNPGSTYQGQITVIFDARL